MKRYAIKDVFDTLQGEGARAGERSVFVRFAGCNFWDGIPEHRDRGAGACAAWCDTDFAKGTLYTAADLIERMDACWPYDGVRWCVLTGGEPLLQVDDELVAVLHDEGWRVAVETNGTQPVPKGVDWVCVSPKKSDVALVLEQAHEVKVVLPGEGRGHAGWSNLELVSLWERIEAEHYFVQPQDPIAPTLIGATHLTGRAHGWASDYDANLRRCIDFVRQHPQWRLGAQLHKLWHLP